MVIPVPIMERFIITMKFLLKKNSSLLKIKLKIVLIIFSPPSWKLVTALFVMNLSATFLLKKKRKHELLSQSIVHDGNVRHWCTMHSKFSIYLEAFSKKSYSIHGIIPARYNVQPLEHETDRITSDCQLGGKLGESFSIGRNFSTSRRPSLLFSLYFCGRAMQKNSVMMFKASWIGQLNERILVAPFRNTEISSWVKSARRRNREIE